MNRSAKFIATSEAGLATQIVLQIVCGILLASWYKATPGGAHAAAEAVRAASFPRLLVGIHFWGGQILMVHSLFHVAAMVWSGAYRDAWIARWYLAIGVALCSFAMLVTGNLLPFDRHGVQSAVTEIGIGGRIPLFGPIVADAMARGPRFGPDTLAGWFAVHRWLLPLAFVALFTYSYIFRDFQETPRKSLWGMWLPSALAVFLSVAVRAPLGSAATTDDFGKFDAVANWYAWPMHGMLKAFETISPDLGWIGTTFVPLLILGFLVFLPRICEKVTPMFVQAVFAIIVLTMIAAAVVFGGAPAPLLDRDCLVGPSTPVAGSGANKIGTALAGLGHCLYGHVDHAGCQGTNAKGTKSGPMLF
jgi:quinol-cytochrome oxidoreductase complex cytochrome b subunit